MSSGNQPAAPASNADPVPPPIAPTEPVATVVKPVMCGGRGDFHPVTEEALKVWDMYKPHLEKQIREDFKLAANDIIKPVQVATQVVSGMNYFFKVELPNKTYAAARVYHVPWRKETHGQAEQVAVQPKALESVDQPIGHF